MLFILFLLFMLIISAAALILILFGYDTNCFTGSLYTSCETFGISPVFFSAHFNSYAFDALIFICLLHSFYY